MKLCKLCRIWRLHSCIAQKTAIFVSYANCAEISGLHSEKKRNVFNAVQLCKLCTPLKGGLGALHSSYPNPLGGAR